MDPLHAALGVLKDRGISGKLLGSRIYTDRVVVVLDLGVSGCPKYEIGTNEIEAYIASSAAALETKIQPPVDQDLPVAVKIESEPESELEPKTPSVVSAPIKFRGRKGKRNE